MILPIFMEIGWAVRTFLAPATVLERHLIVALDSINISDK
jgi:hypothetical protein